MNLYVASSWKNKIQPQVVEALREAGHEVYDFRRPNNEPEDAGFHWSSILGPGYRDRTFTPKQVRAALYAEDARRHFLIDWHALTAADGVVMLQPCGISAALELAYGVGADKFTGVLLAEGQPELMLCMAEDLWTTFDEMLKGVAVWEQEWRRQLIVGDD